ncbi:MAG: hypothetical protein GY751_03045 [Bacteroidetes bacterium]|nr:hypothetical protein [Bacteroidota bacterium]
MTIRLLILAAIVYLAIKYIDKKKGNKRIGRKRRLPQSEFTLARRRFHKLAGEGYFDPVKEQETLVSAFKQLSEGIAGRKGSESYDRKLQAINKIVANREKDARLIKSINKWKQQYDLLGNTFSDGLCTDIEAYIKRSDEILSSESFSVYMKELKLIVRHLPWLIQSGEAGKDNSVHWTLESKEKLENLKTELAAEEALWQELD